MSINYSVCAEVVDIRTDSPASTDAFFVDTNVWFWQTYSKASQADIPPALYQITEYPNYIKKALSSKSTLHWCGLNFAELAHLIEKTELEIYRRSQRSQQISSKQFRHNLPTERQNVVSEIESVCLQLNLLAKPLPTDMDSSFPLSMLTKIQKQPLDGYDVIMVDSINRTGVINIITDDGDYACVPGIRIFTANHNVIQKARAGGSLITRSAASTSSTAS